MRYMGSSQDCEYAAEVTRQARPDRQMCQEFLAVDHDGTNRQRRSADAHGDGQMAQPDDVKADQGCGHDRGEPDRHAREDQPQMAERPGVAGAEAFAGVPIPAAHAGPDRKADLRQTAQARHHGVPVKSQRPVPGEVPADNRQGAGKVGTDHGQIADRLFTVLQVQRGRRQAHQQEAPAAEERWNAKLEHRGRCRDDPRARENQSPMSPR